ncbi:MAG: hypothetical protein ACKOX6_16900 [Bdellovibrio sp.]
MSASAYAQAGLAGYQIISGFQQAELVRENARLSREVNEMNAQAADLDAYHAELNGMTQEARYQQVIDSTLADQKVAYASQKVDAGFGTAAAVTAESKLTASLNKVDIENQAHEQALGIKNQARNIRLQGSMNDTAARLQANSMQNAAIIGAATSATGYFTRKNLGGKSKYQTHTTGEWEDM